MIENPSLSLSMYILSNHTRDFCEPWESRVLISNDPLLFLPWVNTRSLLLRGRSPFQYRFPSLPFPSLQFFQTISSVFFFLQTIVGRSGSIPISISLHIQFKFFRPFVGLLLLSSDHYFVGHHSSPSGGVRCLSARSIFCSSVAILTDCSLPFPLLRGRGGGGRVFTFGDWGFVSSPLPIYYLPTTHVATFDLPSFSNIHWWQMLPLILHRPAYRRLGIRDDIWYFRRIFWGDSAGG